MPFWLAKEGRIGEIGGEAPSDSKSVFEGSSVDRESEVKLLGLDGL